MKLENVSCSTILFATCLPVKLLKVIHFKSFSTSHHTIANIHNTTGRKTHHHDAHKYAHETNVGSNKKTDMASHPRRWHSS
jgi:hypothetical protein